MIHQFKSALYIAQVYLHTCSRIRWELGLNVKMLNVITITSTVSKMMSHCTGSVQMREESESGIRKWEEMWFKMTAEDGEREGAAVTCDRRLFHRRATATGNALSPTVDRRVRRINCLCLHVYVCIRVCLSVCLSVCDSACCTCGRSRCFIQTHSSCYEATTNVGIWPNTSHSNRNVSTYSLFYNSLAVSLAGSLYSTGM